MQARKKSAQDENSYPTKTAALRPVDHVSNENSQSTDFAPDIVWFSIIIQIVLFVSLTLKWPKSISNVLFALQILAPCAAILVASSWKRAVKFAALTTLAIPVSTALLIVAVAIISQLIKPNFTGFINHIISSVTTGLLTWVVLLITLIPLLAITALVRHFWRKPNSNSKS